VTFLFTDVEGSTPRWRDDETAMAAAMREHDRVLAETIADHDGVQFKHTGDGVIAAFASPRRAVAAAVAAQESLGLPVRMGLHTGDAELRDGDYFGTTLNRAARVMDAGHGGQVLVSETTRSLVPDLGVVDLGTFELKGLDGAERLFQVGSGDHPALRARPAVAGNLPRSAGEFIGRDAEIARAIDAVGQSRIVTLFGVGGTGKTRLALEVGRRLGAGTDRGAWFVDLGQVGAGDGVAFAVALGLGIEPAERGDIVDDLIRRIADRTMVAIVDNCEHLLDDVAEVVERLAADCPGVRVIATSREPLMVADEQVVPVGALAADDAVDLFLTRARAEAPTLEFDDRQMEAVVELVRRLDGLPLAIELAAARARSMTPIDLLAGLDERFRLLTGSRRSRAERHQTMRATLDWSYELCDEVDRGAFDELSVFPSGFDLDGAAAIVGSGELARFEVADIVTRLVDRSLLDVGAGVDGGARYRMLETMRAYGREHLHQQGRIDEVRDRHAAVTRSRLDDLQLHAIGPDEATMFARISELLPDAVAAFDRFLDQQDWDAAISLLPGYWFPDFRAHTELAERLAGVLMAENPESPELPELVVPQRHAGDRSFDFEREWTVVGSQVPAAGRDSYSVAITLMDDRELSDGQLELLAAHARRYRDARPITNFLAQVGAGRAFAFNDRPDLLDEVVSVLEEGGAALGSDLYRSAAIEMQAQFHRVHHEWQLAADALGRARRLRVAATGNDLSGIVLLMDFHRIAARALIGERIPSVELTEAWCRFVEFGTAPASFRACSAVATALYTQGHPSLAQSFLASGRAGDSTGGFDFMMESPAYRSELDLVGLVEDPDADVFTYAELIQRLVALDD
jgi:predicted ATPase